MESKLQSLVSKEMMLNTARSCIRTMEILFRDHKGNETEWHTSFYILASTALELYAKLILIKRQEEGTHISKIESYFKELSHDLDKLFSIKTLGSEYLNKANILNVKKINDRELFIYRYEFFIKNTSVPIQVYNPESIRYGLISSKRSNAGMVGYQFKEVLDLCRSVQNASFPFLIS